MSTPNTDVPDEAVERAAQVIAQHVVGIPLPSDRMSEAQRSNLLTATRHALSDARPIVLASRENDTRADELGRWLDVGEVAGYDSVSDLLNAMRVRRNWLMQGVPASPPTSRDSETAEAVAAELERRADEFEAQARVFGNPHDSTPAAGTVATLMDLAREFRADAALLRGER